MQEYAVLISILASSFCSLLAIILAWKENWPEAAFFMAFAAWLNPL